MEPQVEVCIDVGGSGCKISAKRQSQTQLYPFIKFPNKRLFKSKNLYGHKVSKAIVDVLKHHSLPLSVSIIAISQSGDIDHHQNTLIASHRMEDEQETGNPYGQFDIEKQIQKGMNALTGSTPKVILLNDSISGCLDPTFDSKLVLTLTLGTYPVLGLSQKHKDHTKVYYSLIKNWVDEILLLNGWNLTHNLKNQEFQNRNDLENCRMVKEAIVKVLAHYKVVFKWQPSCFVILGGNAHVLKHSNGFPKETGHVKIIPVEAYENAIQCQMKGALHYAKNTSAVQIV